MIFLNKLYAYNYWCNWGWSSFWINSNTVDLTVKEEYKTRHPVERYRP